MERADARRHDPGDAWFWASALVALALHAWLLLHREGLWGGADLVPHLKLIERMAAHPGIETVYAPAYHVLGAVLVPALGLAAYPKVFAFAAAAAQIAAFRFFQRAAELPAACAALFVLAPYSFSLTWCIPKAEGAGYALAFLGLGFQLRRREVALASTLAATFFVHTAAAVFLGFAGGILALARREVRSLAALAAGTLGFAPLLILHLAAGCTLSQSLMLSDSDYLRSARAWNSADVWDLIVALASPIAVALAVAGWRELWQRRRPLGVLCAVLGLLYLNELWLSPFATRSSLNLLRGLPVLSIPVALAGGVALDRHRRALPWLLGACAAWAVLSTAVFVPRSCYVRAIGLDELRELEVDRCSFGWHGPAVRRAPHPSPDTSPRPGG